MTPKSSCRFVIIVVAVAFAWPRNPLAAQGAKALLERPLKLPSLPPGKACAVSIGTRTTVPSQQHIFGGTLWFGAGPVYFALAWKGTPDDNATFSLNPVPLEDGARRAKTPWVSAPSYSGPILIRGRALDAKGKVLRFDGSASGAKNRLELQAPNAPAPGLWSFWPTSMWIPGPGCYGIQIDTPAGTDIVVFSAT